MNPIVEALRAKYKTPRAALAALGLDESLLDGKPKKRAVAAALRGAIKAKTGIAEDAALADLLDLLDALKQSEEGHVSEIDRAEAEAKKAFGMEGGEEAKGEEPGKTQEHTDEFEEDPEPQPKKDKSEMAGLATAPNAGIPALAEKKEEKDEARDEGMEEGVVSDDPATKLHAILKGKLSPEELKEVGSILLELAGGEEAEGEDKACSAKDSEEEEAEDESEEEKKAEDEDEPKAKDEEKKEGSREGAMDAATVKSLINQAVEANNARHLGIRKALSHVKRSPIGEIAMDENWKSSDDVYRAALKMADVPDIDKIHASALPAILDLLPRAGSASAPRSVSRLAQDNAAAKDTLVRFPDANRLKRA